MPLLLFVLSLLQAAEADPLLRQLLQIETQFYSAWQNHSLDAVETNLTPEALAWGEYGIFDRKQQVDSQKNSNSVCKVSSFRLRDARLLKVSPETAMLLYTVDQDAECGGGKVPTPISNSTLYVKRDGGWKVIYRASVNPKKT